VVSLPFFKFLSFSKNIHKKKQSSYSLKIIEEKFKERKQETKIYMYVYKLEEEEKS
jgi:hypothetical protein